MLPLDPSRLPPDSAVVLVARSAGTQPQFVLGDRPSPHFTAALWRRRGPIAGGGAHGRLKGRRR